MSNTVNNAVNKVIELVQAKYSKGTKFSTNEIRLHNNKLGPIPDKNSGHTLASKRWTLANHALNMSSNPLTEEDIQDYYTNNFKVELNCLEKNGDFCKFDRVEPAKAAGGKRKTRKSRRGKKSKTRRC
jgi:hypothetical protein